MERVERVERVERRPVKMVETPNSSSWFKSLDRLSRKKKDIKVLDS